jgi:ribonuclease-3
VSHQPVIEQAASVLGYRFSRESLLTEALTHASVAGHRLQSNERMEFLGDAILGFVVCEYLFHTFPDLLEGELTKIKSAVVSRRVCAKISHQINLAEMLSLGKGMAGRPSLPNSVAAAVLESIIAAIYLDGGLEPARHFILQHMKPFIDEAAASSHQHNFKSALQQYAQKHLPANPIYVLLDEKGPDHAKCFEVCVEINGQRFSSAWANCKKDAEQKAALAALHELELLEVADDDRVELRSAPSDAAATPDSAASDAGN